jgi:hypothetical protein
VDGRRDPRNFGVGIDPITEQRMTIRDSVAVIVALPFLLPAACAEPSAHAGDAWSGTMDTLATGRVLVRNPDAPIWAAGESWQLRERFRVGSAEGDGADLFGQIRDVEVGPNGDVYVLDGQASEVRVFGNDGAHLRTFGRAGQGPGELSRAIGMAFDGEGVLWVNNWGNARYTAYDPGTGEVLREPRRHAGYGMIPWTGRFDRADRLLDIGLAADGEPAILGLDTAFVPVDTLALPRPDDSHQIFFRRGSTVVMAMMEPFAPQPSWSAHPDGGIVVGEGRAYRLHRIGFDGDTTLTIEVARAPVAVTSEERDSALATFRERRTYAADAEPDREPSVADVKPAHGGLFVDDAGHIWVDRTRGPADPPAWDVIDAAGRLLGTVTSPVQGGYVQPSVRGDRLAIATEIDEVPAVIVYDVVRPDRQPQPRP